ncbi:MAG: CHASE2 domain-containing protein [Acidobacteria bacterium]|nr:CHASE2 domain-containing protein [Acidobacteriota bacterium]
MNLRPSLPIRYFAACTAACVAVMAMMAFAPKVFDRPDLLLFDRFAAVLGPGQASGQVVLVEVDEISLAQFGRWPWPRPVVAHLVHAIAAAGASTVALDFVLSEPDAPGAEQSLATAMEAVPVVSGYFFRFEGHPAPAGGCSLSALPESNGSARVATAVVCGAPSMALPAAGQGFLNLMPDADGVLRRAPLVVRYGGQLYPSLALAALRQFRPSGGAAPSFTSPAGADLVLRFRESAGGLPRYSAGQLMKDPAPEPGLRGKLVIVGTSVGGQGAPLLGADRILAASTVHATVADNMLSGDFFLPPGAARAAEWLLVVLVWIVVPQLFIRSRAVPASALSAGLGVVIWLAVLAGLALTGAFASPLPATLALAGSAASCATLKLRWARQTSKSSDHQLASAKHFILNALALLTTMRDPETGDHLQRIERYMRVLCRALSADPRYRPLLSEETIHLMVQLAPIHDVGKVGVPDHILRKAGALTPDELLVIRQHVVFGRDVLQKASDRSGLHDEKFFRMAYELVYSHHERWDGRGYPQGLTGEGIPLAARLMAVADVYDALVSKRVYKEAFSHEEAVRIIKAESARHFDPAVVEAFLRAEGDFRQIRSDSQEAAASAASAS